MLQKSFNFSSNTTPISTSSFISLLRKPAEANFSVSSTPNQEKRVMCRWCLCLIIDCFLIGIWILKKNMWRTSFNRCQIGSGMLQKTMSHCFLGFLFRGTNQILDHPVACVVFVKMIHPLVWRRRKKRGLDELAEEMMWFVEGMAIDEPLDSNVENVAKSLKERLLYLDSTTIAVYSLLYSIDCTDQGVTKSICDVITGIVKESLHPSHIS